MVRAEFELQLSEGSWEDSIELDGGRVLVDTDSETITDPPLAFDPNVEARKIEDWIAFNLDESIQSDHDRQSAATTFLRDIDRLAAFKRTRTNDASTKAPITNNPGKSVEIWPRFQVVRKEGVTVIRLTDRTLLKSDQLESLAADLLDLIDVGHTRIVVNFAGVERTSSLIAAYLAQADRRCRTSDGGSLRVCLIQPRLAGIFAILGLTLMIPSYPDETTAVTTPWPSRTSPNPLPVEILTFLHSSMHNDESPHQDPITPPIPRFSSMTTLSEGPVLVWLMDSTNPDKPRRIGVNRSRFIIGRDPECHLRIKSAHVSKRHASIEQRGGLLFLKDLGSTNGTILNGGRIRSGDTEIRPGDRIVIGDRHFLVASGHPDRNTGRETTKEKSVEDFILGWVHDESESLQIDEADFPTLQDLAVRGESNETRPFKHEVIEGVLVVTPRTHQFSDEEAVTALRTRLQDLFDEPLPRRVVVSLEFVSRLSPQAIGALLAHQLRLERAGGSLRICQASYKLRAALDRIHLPMLMECHATLDDAILVAWP